jgi:hypothetical protein
MLDFRIEWLDAPGVKDRVLARTWARLEIQLATERAHPRCLTLCVRDDSASVRRGVYGPIFSLAEWVVENWWALLNEPLRISENLSGRAIAAIVQQKCWAQRHSLLGAREGAALPDVTIYRDGPDNVVAWAPDPEENDQTRLTRFVCAAGSSRISPAALAASLSRLVESVLERLDQFSDDDTRRLQANWSAIGESRASEADLCASAAALGIDPYDPAELTGDLISLLEHDVASQPVMLKTDLLEASSASTLSRDLEWARAASSKLNPRSAEFQEQARLEPIDRFRLTAHEFAYRQAREFRKAFDVHDDPVDLFTLLKDKCGWGTHPEIILEERSSAPQFAMVGKDERGRPHLVANSSRYEESTRYRLARGLYFLPSADHPGTTRLITGAHTWDQRASRAFAAELLAPAAFVHAELGAEASDECINDLARNLRVSTRVIEHQLTNHAVE